MIKLAKQSKIPFMTIIPGNPKRGTLFDFGADFYQVGRKSGEIAAQILRGTDPKGILIENYAPKSLVVNSLALAGLKGNWHLPRGLRHDGNICRRLGSAQKKIGN